MKKEKRRLRDEQVKMKEQMMNLKERTLMVEKELNEEVMNEGKRVCEAMLGIFGLSLPNRGVDFPVDYTEKKLREIKEKNNLK